MKAAVTLQAVEQEVDVEFPLGEHRVQRSLLRMAGDELGAVIPLLGVNPDGSAEIDRAPLVGKGNLDRGRT